MSNFSKFVQAVRTQLASMSSTGLYEVGVTKEEIWETYLASFPEGTNLIYKERREYDCNCCRQFLRDAGRIVTIVDNNLVSIWDVQVEGYYQPVADALAKLVKSSVIMDSYLHFTSKVGTEKNNALQPDGSVKTWNHFFAELPAANVKREDQIATIQGTIRGKQGVLQRGLETLTLDSAEIVLELIGQNSLYRGEEHRAAVENFVSMKKHFDSLPPHEAENYVWVALHDTTFQPIRNTAIGTLLIDLSDGMDLEAAVKRFEAKVAGPNYKRPTALVSKAMVEKAQRDIEDLGLTDSLPRRFATVDDLTINNVLFANRSVKKAMNVFDELVSETKPSQKSLEKVEEISIKDFMENVLPKATTIEALMENRHTSSLFSLIAPVNKAAPGLFKWGNGFSWSYNGDLTDSIKERVKAAGGNVEGFFRTSLSWYNNDDLDLYMAEPDGNTIYFGNRRSRNAGGMLDIDMNRQGTMSPTRTPVENIVYEHEDRLMEGEYVISVENFSQREKVDVGFEVELEFKGQKYLFCMPKGLAGNQKVQVARLRYSRSTGLEILESIGHSASSKDVWGLKTETFVPVTMVMNSPNHWDGEETGNRHYFFMLDGCNNPDSARGFYNEYLKNELNGHGKVLEVLGAKLRAPHSDNQVSGIGFSTTKRNHLFVKVGGSFNRTLKVLL